MLNNRKLAEKELIPSEMIMAEILEPMKKQMKKEALKVGKKIEIIDAEWTAEGIMIWITR